MVDFVRLSIPSELVKSLRKNPNLDFQATVSNKTGEVSCREVLKVDGLTLSILQGGCGELKGSIHKFRNGGLHNFDQFTISKFIDTLRNLNQMLGIRTELLPLRGLEFGVNIDPKHLTSEVLGGMITYGNKSFSRQNNGAEDYYLQADGQRYLLKVYDKGQQYSSLKECNGNILRFEIKVIKMIHLASARISCLKDLFKPESKMLLRSLLWDAFNKIIFVDPTLDLDFCDPYWRNPKFWQGLDRRSRLREKGRLSLVNYEHSDQVGLTIGNNILQAWDKLLRTENCDKLTI